MWNAVSSVAYNVFSVSCGGGRGHAGHGICSVRLLGKPHRKAYQSCWFLVILPGTGQGLTLCSLLKKKVGGGGRALSNQIRKRNKIPKWGMIKKKSFRPNLYAQFRTNSEQIVTGSSMFLLWAGIHGNNSWELDSYTYTPTQVILWSLIS